MSTTTTKPFTIFTGPTPNGRAVTILLEELRLINPKINYAVENIDISTNVQKAPWFIKLNPNGRIPVLIDHLRNDFKVFESSAILLYIAQHYDKDHQIWFSPDNEPDHYSEMVQWIFFSHGGIGPMQGQASHFIKYAPEDIPYAKKRYLDEFKRLIGVLEIRLKDHDWLAGPGRGKYSIADIKPFPWIKHHQLTGVDSLDEWPNVKAWIARNNERIGTQRGLKVPA